MDYDKQIKKVMQFFYEHPIHSFDLGTIAGYLNISKDTLNEILCELYEKGEIYFIEDEESE